MTRKGKKRKKKYRGLGLRKAYEKRMGRGKRTSLSVDWEKGEIKRFEVQKSGRKKKPGASVCKQSLYLEGGDDRLT